MISVASIWAIVLRHLRLYRHDLNPLLAILYWPLLDILIWGFLGSWIQNQAQATQFQNYELLALLGILLWQLVGRGCNIISFCVLEELWEKNIVNLFSLPLRLIEWMLGIVIFYLLMIVAASIFCVSVTILLYGIPLWDILKAFFIFGLPLIFSGITLGCISMQIIFLLGKRGIELGFIVGWLLLPFSGAYYPVEVLPSWGRLISACLPMSYVFQAMRGYLMHQQSPTAYLIKGYILSACYMIIAFVLFNYCFNYSKRQGLARLAD